MIEPFERTIYIGNEAGLQEHHITVEIKFDGKRLSITGDISNRSKTQLYACGQINMSIDPKKIKYADPWNETRFTHFLAVWNRWHLNDMRAGCEHQERNWEKYKELQIPTYTWTTEYYNARNRAADGKMDMGEYQTFRTISQKVYDVAIKNNRNKEIIELLTNARMIRIKKVETKTANWVTPEEHPEGILTKPCEICGYKYGTKWNFEKIPEEVLEYLRTV